MSSDASNAGEQGLPVRGNAGPSNLTLIRLLSAILALGVFSNFSSQITAANDAIFAGFTGRPPDDLVISMHVARQEKNSQLKTLEEEVQRLRSELEAKNKEQDGSATSDGTKGDNIAENKQQQQQQSGSATSDGTKVNAEIPDQSTTTATNTDKGVCSLLPKPVPHTSAIWNNNLAEIHKSMQHPLDDEYKFHDFTANILHFMTPPRLEKSMSAPTTDYSHVGRILDAAYKRYKYIRDNTKGEMKYKPLKDNDPKAPPTVNILVMGGSVTMGVLCAASNGNPMGLPTGYSRHQRACAWPMRLECFLNNIFKAQIFRVYTVTLGGTNTESGLTIWKYGLQPDDYPHPDILINAYSTNDVHVNSIVAAEAKNKTIHDAVWDLTQKFIRTTKVGCKPPLLIYFDDYIGNEQNEILETTKLSQTIHLLSHYYGTMAVSYATAVRDLVYRGTEEEWFSPHGWFEGREKKWTRQIHPGIGMHIASTFVIAFNMLNTVMTYCSLHPSDLDDNVEYKSINGLPKLREGPVPKGPREKLNSMPPWLDNDLTLEKITARWKEDAEKARLIPTEQSDCIAKRPCVFSFVSGLEKDLKKILVEKLKPHLTHNAGWDVNNDNGKLGYAPKRGVGSKFTLELKGLSEPVKIITFMIMKSYGYKWKGSKVRINASFREGVNEQYEPIAEPMEITGEHDKHTSETYNHEMDLTATKLEGGAAAGGDSRLISNSLVARRSKSWA